ncbi:heat shock 22 kDa protein mitochondrial [Phtheirospermum japonicum]|uniref:Heat shock 22 kDa protein mitochondrial n=1 Tax=Phtheirospermum japonicum TaxID=374723 RepID=A0A830BV73_9LAMI|nr:heat shock 22 kDa protein mitochondrial [Phtheirospermum japonicum]
MCPYIYSPIVASGKWKKKSTAKGIHLRMDMPGLGKEDVKVSVEQNTLLVKGAGKKEFDDDGVTGPGYNNKFDLSEKLYKIKEMKAEMKNGVLKVFVPKIKDEERTDVFDVRVE